MSTRKRTYSRDKTGKFATTGDAVAGKKVSKKKKPSGYVRKTITVKKMSPGMTAISSSLRRRKKGYYKTLSQQIKEERQRRKRRKK